MQIGKRYGFAVAEGHYVAEQKMPLEEQVWLLSMVDIFEPLPQEELEEIGRRAPDIHVRQGGVFGTPDDRGERLYVLKRGRVQVYEVDDEGRELTLLVAEGGTVLGEMALTGQRLSGVYLRALEPSVVCTLRREDLEYLIRRNPEVGLRLVKLLSRRLRVTTTRLAEFAYKDVLSRLAAQILRLLGSEGGVSGEGYKIPTRYTHEQLATMIGSKRVAVSRAFAKLKEEGILELRDQRIHIADPEALKRIAGA
jgi:CRP/FNR family transcriptional regulator